MRDARFNGGVSVQAAVPAAVQAAGVSRRCYAAFAAMPALDFEDEDTLPGFVLPPLPGMSAADGDVS